MCFVAFALNTRVTHLLTLLILTFVQVHLISDDVYYNVTLVENGVDPDVDTVNTQLRHCRTLQSDLCIYSLDMPVCPLT